MDQPATTQLMPVGSIWNGPGSPYCPRPVSNMPWYDFSWNVEVILSFFESKRGLVNWCLRPKAYKYICQSFVFNIWWLLTLLSTMRTSSHLSLYYFACLLPPTFFFTASILLFFPYMGRHQSFGLLKPQLPSPATLLSRLGIIPPTISSVSTQMSGAFGAVWLDENWSKYSYFIKMGNERYPWVSISLKLYWQRWKWKNHPN